MSLPQPTALKRWDDPNNPSEPDDIAVNQALNGRTSAQQPAYPSMQQLTNTASVYYPGMSIWDAYLLQAVQAVYAQATTTTGAATLWDRIKALHNTLLQYRADNGGDGTVV